MTEMDNLKKEQKQIFLSFEIAIIIAINLFVVKFSWELSNDIKFTILCICATTLFLIATCSSVQGDPS